MTGFGCYFERMMRGLLLTALCASAACAQTIDGLVTDAVSGRPVPGVEVTVYAGGRGKPARELSSDTQRVFRVDGLEPGDYSLTYSAKGFDGPGKDDPATRLFHLASGGFIHLDVAMVPRAKVSGRVLTESGEPVAGARVWLLGGREGYDATTDAEGHYAIDAVLPASYRMLAQPPKGLKPPPPRNEERMGWVLSFYPGVTDANAATRITTAAGLELSDRDIRLVAAPVHRVHGTVRDAGGPVAGVRVTLESATSIFRGNQERQETAVTAEDGAFEFPDVADGPWRLSAEAERQGVKLRAATEEHVAGSDLAVRMQLEPPFELPVTVKLDPPPQNAKPGRTPGAILMQIGNPGGGIHMAMPSGDGGFRIAGVYAGKYNVSPVDPGPPYYLASIQVGERDVLGRDTVEIPNGALPLTITFRADGGTVRGTVEDCGTAKVVLIPQEQRLRIPVFMRQASCGAGGRFEIGAVRPGDYYVFAFDRPPGVEDLFFGLGVDEGLLRNGVRATVRPGEMTAVDLMVTVRP